MWSGSRFSAWSLLWNTLYSRLGIRPEQYDHPHIWDFNQWLISSQDAQNLDFLWIFLGQTSRGQIITTKLCQTIFNIQCASMFSSRIPILVKPLVAAELFFFVKFPFAFFKSSFSWSNPATFILKKHPQTSRHHLTTRPGDSENGVTL